MAETRSAKKRKNDGGSGGDGENLSSSAGGSELNPGVGSSDVVRMVAAMQKEMEKLRRGMAKMEGGMKDLRERNEILEDRLRRIEDENQKLEVESKMDDLDKRMKKSQIGREAFENFMMDDYCEKKAGFNRMEKSLAHHRNLIKNQQWENPAPRIRSSYWASNGYDEETTAGLKSLVKKIRGVTRYMRLDGESGMIGVSKENDERVLPFDDVLLPQWEEFANALRQYRHFIDQCPETVDPWFCISYAQLPRQILDLFEEALADTHFKKITFGFNNAGRDMTSFLSNITKSNPKLETLMSSSNPIEHEQDFEALVDAVSTHPSLRTLSLVGSCRELSYNTILSLFSSTLQCENIDLSSNSISTLGNTFLERYLEENASLEFLLLRDNNLDDFDAKSIARGLEKNDALAVLDIRGNDITEHGKEALLRAVFDSTTLHSAARSNHSCAVKCDDERLEKINKSFDKQSNRRQKLYSVLSSRNKESNNVAQLGESVVREHIPAILDVVQKYAEVDYGNEDGFEAVPPLSIVYEILRGWSMPVLYESA